MSKAFKKPERMVVLRYRFIGDTVLMVPFLRNLRRAYPEAIMDVVVAPQSGELLTHCPYINELIYFDRNESFLSQGLALRNKKYDTAFVLKRSWSSALMALLTGAKQRVGFDTEGRGFLLTHRIPYDQHKPEALCFTEVLEGVGIPVADTHLDTFVTNEETAWAIDVLAHANESNPERVHHVGVHITASNPVKELPISFWTKTLTDLLTQHSVQLHAVGAPSDAARYEALRDTLPEALRPFLHNHCGQSTLLQSQALVAQYHSMMGVDSGPLHMAAAANRPTLGYYLPSQPSKWQAAYQPDALDTPASHHSVALTEPTPETWLNAWIHLTS